MKKEDFYALYQKDVDFKELVDYLSKLAAIYSLVDNVSSTTFGKEETLNEVPVESIRMIFVSGNPLFMKIITDQAKSQFEKFVFQKLKELNANIQNDVHN